MSPRRLPAVLLFLSLIVWSGAPLLHLVLEHGHGDGDHRFCSLFQHLSQQPASAAASPAPDYRPLGRADGNPVERPALATAAATAIRAPPISA